VRLGSTKPGGVDPRTLQALRDGEPDLGDLPWRNVAGYLALADAYVQPGAPDDFNRYRLPSKLPEFFAMGRPVVLPACNLGNDLTDGEEALLLHEGKALEIAARIEQLLDHSELARRLGQRARSFALEGLSWSRNAAALADFYRRRLDSAPAVAAV
jgi:glycosyltransferase involved in cell wall biosynthesis